MVVTLATVRTGRLFSQVKGPFGETLLPHKPLAHNGLSFMSRGEPGITKVLIPGWTFPARLPEWDACRWFQNAYDCVGNGEVTLR